MRFRLAVLAVFFTLLAGTSCTPSGPPEPPPPDWLWVSVWGSNKLLAFHDQQLEKNATGAQATLAIGLGAGRSPYGFDFDDDGNLWVGTQEGELLGYAASDVRTSGTPVPFAGLTTGVLHVAAVRFATDGSLWATMEGKVVSWSAATLAAGGSPAPDVTLTSASAAMSTYPNDLVFDAGGGLWIPGIEAVLRFSPAQLVAGGDVEPDVIIGSDGTSLKSPRGLAFDANGDLWVTSFVSSTVEKFRQEDLLASGAPAPVVTLTPPGINKMRVAFDDGDNMWVSAVFAPSFATSGFVAKVAPANRVSSGPAPASAEFSELGSIDAGGAIVFHPGQP